MLHQRSRQPVPRVIPLQTFREGCRHRPREICVFPERLFTAAPPRIPRQIRVGRTHHNSHSSMLVASLIHRKLRVGIERVPRFIPFHTGHLPQQIRVPCFCQSDRLRKLRGRQRLQPFSSPSPRASQRHAVQSFDVRRTSNAQPRHTRIG